MAEFLYSLSTSAFRLLLVVTALTLAAPASHAGEPAASNFAAPPAWSVDPANYQFSMFLVIKLRYNQVPVNNAGNMIGVFVGQELRGVGTGTNIGGQIYFFVTVYSNQYTGESLQFKTYYAPDDKVYATQESVGFTHFKSVGTLEVPFWININPNLDFAPDLLPFPDQVTLQDLPFAPIHLADYLISLDGDPVSWTVQAGPNLMAAVSNGVLTVTPVLPGWTGTEILTITATENTTNHYAASAPAQFTILADYGPPVFQTIPPRAVYAGNSFLPFDLDDFLNFNGPCRAFGFDMFPFAGAVADPAWPAVPPGAQSMKIVARPQFGDIQLAGPGAKLAAFVGGNLVGTAMPAGAPPVATYTLFLENLASGPITFKFYHAENQYLYEKTTALNFIPGGSVGTVASPYKIQLAPLVPLLAPDGSVQISIVDTSWRGTLPVHFMVWDCNFPVQRRDTAAVALSVLDDDRPRLISPTSVSFQENACYTLYDAQAVDPNDSEGNGLTYSLAGGADAAKFSIDATTGVLSWFNFTPSFAAPADANGDNKYEVDIKVTNTLLQTDMIALVVMVTQDPDGPFNPQLTGSAGACITGGSATLQASGGAMYLWSTTAVTASIPVSVSGTYTVTITDGAGCSAVLSKTVQTAPTITAAGNTGLVCVGAGIVLTSTPAGGSGVYTGFSWAGPNAFSSQLEDPLPFAAAPASAGTYTVTVTDNAGCSATATVALAVSANSAPSISATANTPLCLGKTITLGSTPAAGSGNYTKYKWTGPNNFSSNSRNPAAFVATLSASGAYTVELTDNQGCTATGTVAVQVNPIPALTATGNSPVCVGKTIQLGAAPSGGSGAYPTFSWAGPNAFAASVQNPAGFAASLPASGVYTVTVTDGAGCTATSTVGISVSGVPTIAAMSAGAACQGGTVALLSTPAGGSGVYALFSWAGPSSYSAAVEDPPSFPAIPAASGTYTVTVTDNAGCSATATTAITVYPAPMVSASSNSPVCQGASLLLSSSASGGAGMYAAFNWSGPDNYLASAMNPAGFASTANSAGAYQVKVTDANGCTATATTTVVVVPKPNAVATNNGPACQGATVFLNVAPSGGSGVFTGYSWSGPNSYAANTQNPAGFAATLPHAGTYRVTVTDNAGCTATASTSLAVSSRTAPVVSPSSNSPLCVGSNLILSANATGGSGVYSSYAWAGPNNFSAAVAAPPAFPATPLSAGTYTVTVTDNAGCFNSGTTTVAVANVVASAGSNVMGCILSGNILLHSSATGGSGVYTSYAWSGPNGYQFNQQNPPGFPAVAAASGVYTVTVTDNTGCSGTATVSITVGDALPPTISCPANLTLAANSSCQGMLGDHRSKATNLTDNCTDPQNILVTQMPASSTVLTGHNDFRTVTLTADDGNGNTASCTFTLTLKDATAPSITCPADQTVAADNACTGLVGNRLNLATGLSDNCTLAGSLALSQLPAAATVLSGHNDFRAVTLSATDAAGNTGTCSFNVTLKDISPPTITCPANFTLAADAQCEGLVGDGTALVTGVSDNCTAAAAIALTQSPAANTVISGHNAFQVVTVTADDGNGNTKSCNYQVTLKDVSPPTMTCPQDHTVAANQFCYNYVGDIFLLVADLKDNCTPVANIIKTQVPDANTVLVGHNSFRNVTISADDGLGNVKTCSLTVTLKDITPPVVSCPGPLLRGCAINIPLPNPGLASAFDNCGPAFITHLSDSAPYDQTCADRFKITRTYKAQDGAGNTATCTQVITVNDVQTPYFTSSPSNTTVQCNAIPSVGTPVAVDGCGGGVTISYLGETRTNGSCADTYTLVRTWRATDQCGNSRTVTQRISVRDTQKPTFTFIPANITIACTTPLPSPGQPTAVDNCDTDVSIAYYGEWNMSSTCPGTYQLLRYWQATDNCGNAAFGSQIITVQDNQAPVFTSVPAPVTINCNDPIPPTVNPTVYDSCGNFTQVTFLGTVRTDGSCLYNYTLTRSWRAEDYCGNSATVSQVITVRDVQAPVFNNPPANISVTCANIPGAPALSATDNCGSGTVTYLGQTTSPGDCASGYTIERRWRAADLCANTRLHTQTITVMPNQYVPGVSGRETGAEANRAVPGFRLVPNPASGRVRLDLADFKGKSLQLALLTPHGALVYEQKIWSDGEAPVFIDLHALGIASGLYLVSVRTAEGQVWVERLLVQQE